jgi:uncharacterized protein DUF6236
MSTFEIPTSKYGKALYYPHIKIQDENWLKLALLYWDGIRRIVPPDTYDLSEIDEGYEVPAVLEAKLIENTDASPYVEGAERRFLERFPTLLEMRADVIPNQTGNPGPSKSYEIHAYKMSEKLRYELKERKLARESGPWLEMDRKVGLFYMMCLATEMGESFGAPVVTDTHEFEACGEYLSFGELPTPSTATELNSALVRLNIEFPRPEDLADIPMAQVINFHIDHARERQSFRGAIENIANNAAEITDANALEDYVGKAASGIQNALKAHRESLKELNIKSLTSALKISTPGIVASGTAALVVSNPVLAGLLAMAGITVSVAEWWADRRGKRRQESRSSDYHYLLSVKREFGS